MSFAQTREELSAAANIIAEIHNYKTPTLARILTNKCLKMLANIGVSIKIRGYKDTGFGICCDAEPAAVNLPMKLVGFSDELEKPTSPY